MKTASIHDRDNVLSIFKTYDFRVDEDSLSEAIKCSLIMGQLLYTQMTENPILVIVLQTVLLYVTSQSITPQ